MKYLIILLSLISVSPIFSQTDNEVFNIALKGLQNDKSINLDSRILVNDELTLSNLENISLIGKEKAELVTFNTIPHIIKIKNCKNITFDKIKLRIGVENVGDAIVIIEGSENVTFKNCELGNYGKWAFQIDSLSKNVLVDNCFIHHCKESGIQSFSPNITVTNTKFEANSKIGRFEPDLDIQVENGYPLIRYNNYRVTDYLKHKNTVDEFVDSRNSISYNFDCFKIVKKFLLKDGSSGKLTAFFEGENNKILDKMEVEYKGQKGQITATAYFLHKNLAYTKYEFRKGKISLNYMVYGDFLDHLEQSDPKASAHISGTPEENRMRYDQWLKAIESWKLYSFDEVEEFELYENKDKFIALPY